jgi:Fe-S-cluster-containing dehydrogenase component
MEFEERTIKVIIDTTKCPDCSSKACVDACQVYDRGILQLSDGKPSVSHLSPEEVKRRGTECLACEYACWQLGNNAIRIEVPIKGLDEYLRKRNLR